MENNKLLIKRIGGYLHKLTPIKDSTGKIINHAVTSFMVEFRARDLMQVIVGASVLAVPVAFTEETWNLGRDLPLSNVMILGLISLFFIAIFDYFNFYRYNLKNHKGQYIKRVLTTYLCSVFIVIVLLTLINKCPWGVDNIIAFKRIIIVTFPSSMSAVISDNIK